MKMLAVYDEFRRWHIMKGSKQSTIDGYDSRVKKIFIGRNVGDIESTDLTVREVEDFYIRLRESDLAINTITSYSKQINAFLNFMYEKHFSDIDFKRELPKFRSYKVKRELYRDDEIIAIFSSIHGTSCTSWMKRLIFALFLETGMRSGELLNLKVDDISYQGRPYVKIHGSKGYEDRTLPLSHQTYQIYQRYLIKRRQSDSDFLFISRDRTQLSKNSLKSYIETNIKGIGIRRGNMKLFRHTCITKWLLQGNSTMVVMMWAGHKKSETTENYWHYSNEVKMAGLEYKESGLLLSMVPLPKYRRSNSVN